MKSSAYRVSIRECLRLIRSIKFTRGRVKMLDFVMGLFLGAIISWVSMVLIINHLMDRYDKR